MTEKQEQHTPTQRQRSWTQTRTKSCKGADITPSKTIQNTTMELGDTGWILFSCIYDTSAEPQSSNFHTLTPCFESVSGFTRVCQSPECCQNQDGAHNDGHFTPSNMAVLATQRNIIYWMLINSNVPVGQCFFHQ